MFAYKDIVEWRRRFFGGHSEVTADEFTKIIRDHHLLMSPEEIKREWERFRQNPYWIFLQVDPIAEVFYALMMERGA